VDEKGVACALDTLSAPRWGVRNVPDGEVVAEQADRSAVRPARELALAKALDPSEPLLDPVALLVCEVLDLREGIAVGGADGDRRVGADLEVHAADALPGDGDGRVRNVDVLWLSHAIPGIWKVKERLTRFGLSYTEGVRLR
jgi:hypothetical protein